MKKIIFLIFCSFIYVTNNVTIAQTYTTESKSCGSCHQSVSIYSKIGDYCPHCGVRWGYENTTKKTKKSYEYSTPTYSYPGTSSYDNYSMPSYGTVFSNSNLRAYPSKNSSVITVIPAYSSVEIIERQGSWYYVRFTKLSLYGSNREYEGYVHKSLVK
jgi:predicted RNA-binding Zn-ribbon protein involved in translation (DUF1610 family)